MPKKKPQPEQPEQTTSTAPREMLSLSVGVNFIALGDTEETRIEAGTIEIGVLPSAFQAQLIERKLAQIVRE